MSYLHTPRICFRGNYLAAGPTRNNLLALLDDPTLLEPRPPLVPRAGWDYHPMANGDFRLVNCEVVGEWDEQGRFIASSADDSVIGAAVMGTGKMADLEPAVVANGTTSLEHRRKDVAVFDAEGRVGLGVIARAGQHVLGASRQARGPLREERGARGTDRRVAFGDARKVHGHIAVRALGLV